MSELEILYDHYKDTYSLSKQAQDKRNKYFLFICIIEFTLFFFVFRPNETTSILLGLLSNISNTHIALSVQVLQCFLWVILVYFSIRYCQSNLYEENQYKYLERLEIEISSKLSDFNLNRESGNYLDKYPKALDFIHIFYTWVFPVLYVIINFIKISSEWIFKQNVVISIIDSVFCIFCFILMYLYFIEIHPRLKLKKDGQA